MKNIKDVLFVIQARLSSKRAPGKMLRPFAGSTLMDIAIQKVLKSKVIPKENFYLSVYEKDLVELGCKYGVNIYRRSKQSADAENSLTDLYEWHDKLPFKYAVKINACTPFLKIETIDEFVRTYLQMPQDGLFGVVKKKNYFWDNTGQMISTPVGRGEVMNTKIVEPTYEAAHTLYAGRMDLIGQGIWMGTFVKDDPVIYDIPEEEALDIDYEWQFTLYESLYLSLRKDGSSLS